MTVEEMGDRMSSDEYIRWQAFYAYRQSVRDKEARKAKQRHGR